MSLSEKTTDILGRQPLTSVKDALALLRVSLQRILPRTESICLDEALDRIISKNTLSPKDLPDLARSTMDGFAAKEADTFGASQFMPCNLQISGEVLKALPILGKSGSISTRSRAHGYFLIDESLQGLAKKDS